VFFLERSDVVANDLKMSVFIISLEKIISSVFLVGSDEVRIVNRLHWLVFLHIWFKLFLKLNIKDLSSAHGLGEIDGVDVPARNDQIARIYQGNNFLYLHIDLSVDGVSDLHGWTLGHRSEHVGFLQSFLGIPAYFLSVGNNSSKDSGSVVSSQAYHHNTYLSGVLGSLELIEDVIDFGGDSVGRGGSRHGSMNVLRSN
jgi:hypothetical protein